MICRLTMVLCWEERRSRRRRGFKKWWRKKKDGKDRRRGSGHHSLSQLTQPSGVGAVCLAFPLSPYASSHPHTLPSFSHLPTSLILTSSLCGDRRRRISLRINHGSSFHCRVEHTEGGGIAVWPLESWFQIVKMYPEGYIKGKILKYTLNA